MAKKTKQSPLEEAENRPEDPIDPEDYKSLLQKIFRQAMDDYVKLQHPSMRRRKYLEEAFQSSVSMLFDSDYRLMYLKNQEGEEMSITDIIRESMEVEDPDLKKMREHVIEEANRYWNERKINTLFIPDSLVVEGHVYTLEHSEEMDVTDSCIDIDDKTIVMNKGANSENEEQLIIILVELIAHHSGIKIPGAQREAFAKALFRTLRINNCFTGI